MYTKNFVTIDVDKWMLKQFLMEIFSEKEPSMAESLEEHFDEFVSAVEQEIADDAFDSIARRYRDFMDDRYLDESVKRSLEDERFFEEHLMWPVCSKCKEVDEYTRFHSTCVFHRELQCSSAQGAEEWVNSERYQDALNRVREMHERAEVE